MNSPRLTCEAELGMNNTSRMLRVRLVYFLPLLSLLSLLFASFVPARVVSAQGAVPDDQTYHIAKKLNCPTCAGRNLADCPTETCAQWKAEIKAQLDAGKSADEIMAYFQDRFGATVLQEPPKTGSTAPLWAVPAGAAAVFLIGAAIVMTHVSRRTAVVVQPLSSSASADPFVMELEREVKESA